MKTKIIYTSKAEKDLRSLDKKIAQKIIQKTCFYSEQKNLQKYAKKLKPPLDDLFRFRIGDYRVIFEMDKRGNLVVLTVLTIKNRKDVYG